MLNRTFGALAAVLSVGGLASAQQPSSVFASRPAAKSSAPFASAPFAFAPSGRAPTVTATRADTPLPTPAAQTLPSAAPTLLAPSTPAGNPSYVPTAAMLGGEACGPAGCPLPTSCSTCDCLCGPPGKFWVAAQYIGWTAKGQNLPPLVTASPAGTPRQNAGVLGAPGTTVLYGGNSNYNNNWRSGLYLNAGMWLDECQRFGIGGNFFFLGTSHNNYNVASDGSQIISRPFFNALQNRQDSQLVSFNGTPVFPDSQLVSFPGVLAGGVNVDSKSNFIGGGINTICNICCDPCGRLDLLLGYRYLNLRDEVTITENLTALPGSNVPAGTRFIVQDRIRTNNNFHGGVLGFNYERRFGHYFLGVSPSVALGVTHTTVDIDGATTIIQPNGQSQTYPGGLLAQNSNIGHYTSNAFSVVPQISVRAGVQLTDHLRAFVSYNYIYWSNVARAGDQFDQRVNTNQIPPSQGLGGGPALPAFQLQRTGYWVQGIGGGLEYRF